MLHSTVLNGRRLTVYVPDVPSGLPATGMPLLILHDGQNLFDPERSYVHGHTWAVAETADALIADGAMPPTVIVGIDHAGERRVREFGHGAGSYARFVTREVLPHLRSNFPVSREREHTALGGSSMGGLVTLQIAAHHPDVFGRLYVFSPSVWWNRREVLRTIRRPGLFDGWLGRPRGLAHDARVWLSIGLQEGDDAVANTRRLRDVIITMRRGDQSKLRYVEYSDGTHSEDSWQRQFKDALRDTLKDT